MIQLWNQGGLVISADVQDSPCKAYRSKRQRWEFIEARNSRQALTREDGRALAEVQ